jgi:hypothetical protein
MKAGMLTFHVLSFCSSVHRFTGSLADESFVRSPVHRLAGSPADTFLIV